MSKPHNVFAGAYVDRAAEFRADVRWQARALSGDGTRFLLVGDGCCLTHADAGRLALLSRREVPVAVEANPPVLLGLSNNAPVFALLVRPEDVDAEALDAEFVDLRTLGTLLGPNEANLAAHATAMARWQEAQRYCSRCGHETAIEAAGYASLCSNEECRTRVFPRVDPAIIVLVDDGERCLLGRQPSWPATLYSTIAGFVEPGESLEDAVRREVYEETNIRVEAIRYRSSQPWPFPAALMLGFRARATSTDIQLNDGELSDVRWFTRDELDSGDYRLPAAQSIARRLVGAWLDGDEPGSLEP